MSSTEALLKRVNSSAVTLLPTASERRTAKQKTRAKDTAGPGWFDLPATPVTPELEKDLRVLSMRGAIDRKQFYRGEQAGKSRYFQMGTVVDSAAGFYSDRLTRKQRPRTLVDTLLKDESSKAYFKKKYDELQTKYQSGRYKGGVSKRTGHKTPSHADAPRVPRAPRRK